MGSATFDAHLKRFDSPTMLRYALAVGKVCRVAAERGVCLLDCGVDDVACCLSALAAHSSADARCAFALMTNLLGLHMLRFNPLLLEAKKQWNQSVSKYADFWDMHSVLHRLGKMHLNWASVEQVRLRLLLSLRFFHLFRSIELARCFRTISFLNCKFWILAQRKGHVFPQWENLLEPNVPALSPVHLLRKYVALASHGVPPWGKVFVFF